MKEGEETVTGKVYRTAESFFKQNRELGLDLPYSEDLTVFQDPLQIGSKMLPNRLAYQAMEGCDGTGEGSPGKLTIRRYDRFASGGAGLIWYEATAVMPEGRENPRQLWFHRENLDDFTASGADSGNGTASKWICSASDHAGYSLWLLQQASGHPGIADRIQQ